MAALAVDAFLTIFSPIGGGPLTNFWMKGLWKIFLNAHKKRPIHRTLQMLGPIYLALIVVIWYFWMNVGWFLIFASAKAPIINSSLGSAPGTLERLYYTGSTLSTLGLGDYIPQGFPWTLMSNMASFGATFLITISLSYVLPVISAANKRKELAEHINALGDGPYEIIECSWAKHRGEFSNQHISSVMSMLNGLAHQHLIYPVLHFFHNSDLNQASSRAVLNLSDAFFLITKVANLNERPPLAAQRAVWSTLRVYKRIKSSQTSSEDNSELFGVEHLRREKLQELGFEVVTEKEFHDALAKYKEFRKELVSICVDDGWGSGSH